MITQTIRRGETIIRIAPTVALVASKSEVGRWHTVTPESCDCRGFEFRHTCRHISVAFPAVLACEHCGSLTNLVTDSRFVAGVGQVEETHCRVACGQPMPVAPIALAERRTTFTPPSGDRTLRGLYPARA